MGKKRILPKYKIEDKTKKVVKNSATGLKLNPKYWDDPVYHYLSALKKSAIETKSALEIARVDDLIKKVVNTSITEIEYNSLLEQYRQFKKMRKKQKQVQQQKPAQIEETARLNISELKRRIFNPQTSPENMIKALEMLPKDERVKTVGRLTAFLRSKILPYLKQKGYR